MPKLDELFSRCMEGKASAEQQQELLHLLAQPANEEEGRRLFRESLENDHPLDTGIPEERLLQIRQAITALSSVPYEKTENIQAQKKQPAIHRVHFLRYWRWAAALVLLISAAYLWQRQDNKTESTTLADVTGTTDIQPGSDGAVLTLADGTRMVLDSLENGMIANENGTQVLLKDGQLAYQAPAPSSGDGPVSYNTITTPNGRQFSLVLPDGSKVWLNAASSVKYPTRFISNERRVEITGEVYFEVAKNDAKAFKVLTPKQQIEVTGTHFNVNAYDNEEAEKTTLLEGRVRISSLSLSGQQDSRTLMPGQQLVISPSAMTVRNNVNLDNTMAWKNGYFNFEGVDIRELMRQVERWYDVEVVFEKNVPDIHFGGGLSRDNTLSELIEALKDSEVHFKIEGKRKLIVLP